MFNVAAAALLPLASTFDGSGGGGDNNSLPQLS
jgi:hypothetical protein